MIKDKPITDADYRIVFDGIRNYVKVIYESSDVTLHYELWEKKTLEWVWTTAWISELTIRLFVDSLSMPHTQNDNFFSFLPRPEEPERKLEIFIPCRCFVGPRHATSSGQPVTILVLFFFWDENTEILFVHVHITYVRMEIDVQLK